MRYGCTRHPTGERPEHTRSGLSASRSGFGQESTAWRRRRDATADLSGDLYFPFGFVPDQGIHDRPAGSRHHADKPLLSIDGIMAAGSVHPPTRKPAPGIANITVVAAALLVSSLPISSHVCHCCRVD